MSTVPQTVAKPAASPRQPLSVRELFCLTTLAAITVAIVLYREWSNPERWLLGLTLGGTLLGILAARSLARRSWLSGTSGGLLGASSTAAILAVKWLENLRLLSVQFPDGVAHYQQRYLWAGCATVCCGLLLTIAVITAFGLMMWLSNPGEAESAPSDWTTLGPCRGDDVWHCGVGLIANFDFVVNRRAWMPRYHVPLPPRPMHLVSSGIGPESNVSLSHNGRWLALRVYDPGGNNGRPLVQLYGLDEYAHVVDLPRIDDTNEFRSLAQFSCDDDRCAYGVNPESGGRFPGLPVGMHLFDPGTMKEELLEVSGQDVTWLPGNKLIIDSVLLTEQGDHWSTIEIEEPAYEYYPRLGYAVHLEQRLGGPETARLVDLNTDRTIAMWSEAGAGYVSFSSDGRFALGSNLIEDRQHNCERSWIDDEGYSTIRFYTFTNGGHAVGARNDWLKDGVPVGSLRWLQVVPFGRYLQSWLWREPICLIDPASGEELGRTQPLWSEPDDIAFSFDGSRMVVINLEGVYIYDVPAEFR